MTDPVTLHSIAANIYANIDNVPTAISGNMMLSLINRQRQQVENYTGISIGSTSIPEKYENAIFYLSAAEVTTLMSMQGSDKGYSLGDLSVDANNQGGGASSITSAYYREAANQELRILGRKRPMYRTY